MTKKTRALCIVAHPDDETIWMGGTIMKNRSWKWTILSLCRRDDTDRMPKFRKVCAFYDADAIISNLDDYKLKPLKIKDIEDKIKSELSNIEYDYIYTHGENGEYGHLRHREIHKAVKSLVRKKELKCEKLFFFSYDIKEDNRIPEIVEGDFKVELNKQELRTKQKLVTQYYGFKDDSFEALSSCGKEAFVYLR